MSAHAELIRRLMDGEGDHSPEAEIRALDLFRAAEEDGGSYGILLPVIENLMGEHADVNRWDEDAAAVAIHEKFLAWLPDMVGHANARLIREWVENRPQNDYCRKAAARRMADMIDPFRRCDEDGCDRAPHWVRKRDGEEVPWNVLGADEEE